MKIYKGWDRDPLIANKKFVRTDKNKHHANPGDIYLSPTEGIAARWVVRRQSCSEFVILKEYVPLHHRIFGLFKKEAPNAK